MPEDIASNHETRLTKVESEIASLTRLVEQSVQIQREDSERTQASIRHLAQDLRTATSNPTDWKLVLGAVGFIVVLMTTLGSMALNPIRERQTGLEQDVSAGFRATAADIQAHREREGHPAMVAEFSRLESDIKAGFLKIDQQLDRAADAVNTNRSTILGLLNDTRGHMDLPPYNMGGYVLWFQD